MHTTVLNPASSYSRFYLTMSDSRVLPGPQDTKHTVMNSDIHTTHVINHPVNTSLVKVAVHGCSQMLSSTDPSQRTWISVNGRLPGKGADVASLILTFSDSGFHQLNILKQRNWKVVPNVLVQGWTRGNRLIPWRPRLHGQPWLTIASFTHEQRIMMRWPLSHP